MPYVDAGRLRVMLVGGGGREHAMGEALCRSGRVDLFTVASNQNPGLEKLGVLLNQSESDPDEVCRVAVENDVELAVVGLETPLYHGVVDRLLGERIPTVGPSQAAARLETSKVFTRRLMEKYEIPGQIEFQYFDNADEMKRFLASSAREFALKPIGLTGGKGVRVMGVHLTDVAEAMEYGEEVIRNKIGGQPGILLEERLKGEEFTLQAFVDGKTVVPMPLVQDFKRAFDGDLGPNTGGMGSYSCPDGLLPFLTHEDLTAAKEILCCLVHAMSTEGHPYVGILYGQFMKTKDGVKLVETNARFGDPEAINVLSLIQSDLLDICQAVTQGALADTEVAFARQATVCKYISPAGYGVNPIVGEQIEFDEESLRRSGVRLYFAKMEHEDGQLVTTSSRSAALLGIGDSVSEAEELVELAMQHVNGQYHVRHDIGKGITEGPVDWKLPPTAP